MKNIFRLAFVMTAAITLFLFSCQKEAKEGNTDPGKPHAARIYLTDHATPVFDSVFIDIQKLEVKLEEDTLPNGGWLTPAIRPGV